MDNFKKTKKKDKKTLFLLFGLFVFFAIFIIVLIIPSSQTDAIEELKICSNKKEVEAIWYKYKADLYQDEEFILETKTKLVSFNLSDEEINECRSWLPPAPESINIVIVPDLSRRIIDNINNPNQIENDISLLRTIWKSFVDFSKLKQDSKDKLIVEVTDIDQAKGQFGIVADKLQYDLSNHKGQINRLFFSPEKDKQFEDNIEEMYKLAKDKPLGADYRFYLRRYLANHLKKSTLFDNYKNKVIIITDGYLEPETSPADTKIYSYQEILYPSVLAGNTLEIITSNGLNIPKVNIDLSNTDVLVCEVNERKEGKGYDFEILKTYWDDWFKRMNVKKFTFIQREQSNLLTAKRVKDFINE